MSDRRSSLNEPEPSPRVRQFRRLLLPLSLGYLGVIAIWHIALILNGEWSGFHIVGGLLNAGVGLCLAYQGWEFRRTVHL